MIVFAQSYMKKQRNRLLCESTKLKSVGRKEKVPITLYMKGKVGRRTKARILLSRLTDKRSKFIYIDMEKEEIKINK